MSNITMGDKVAEIFLDTTKKLLAIADEYGENRNDVMCRAANTFLEVSYTNDFSIFPIGGDS